MEFGLHTGPTVRKTSDALRPALDFFSIPDLGCAAVPKTAAHADPDGRPRRRPQSRTGRRATDEGIASSGEQAAAAQWVTDMLGCEKNRCHHMEFEYAPISNRTRQYSIAADARRVCLICRTRYRERVCRTSRHHLLSRMLRSTLSNWKAHAGGRSGVSRTRMVPDCRY